MATTSKEEKTKAWRTEKTGNSTVAIYRRDKHHKPSGKTYQVFEVADYTTGQRRLQSFSDPANAIAEAQRIGRLLATGETTAAKLRGSEAASYGRAVELIRAAGLETPLELVAARYVEAVKILGTEKIVEAASDYIRRNPAERPARTVRQVADELIALKTHRKASARYIEDLKIRLAKLATRFAVRVDTVTTADVQEWLDGMDGAPRTIRNFRQNASGLFKFAEARGYIARGENPVTATERLKTKTADAIEIYSPSELTRLLAAAPESFKPVLAIQAFAGLRSAEVMRLDWQNVKLGRGHIEITAANAKTASRRIVPILPNLAVWLKDAAKKTGKIFPHTRAYFHEMQRDISAKTKTDKLPALPWKHNALRHSFISYRVADIQNVAQVALEAGNSPGMIFGHYRELVTADDAKTWFAIAPAKKTGKRTTKPTPFISLPSRATTPAQQLN
ncbi:MAG: site-specific integrase [Verrucomicrobiae bacterium]|nr:site-specific integrase [Verrucomicrobiae bacterium]